MTDNYSNFARGWVIGGHNNYYGDHKAAEEMKPVRDEQAKDTSKQTKEGGCNNNNQIKQTEGVYNNDNQIKQTEDGCNNNNQIKQTNQQHNDSAQSKQTKQEVQPHTGEAFSYSLYSITPYQPEKHYPPAAAPPPRRRRPPQYRRHYGAPPQMEYGGYGYNGGFQIASAGHGDYGRSPMVGGGGHGYYGAYPEPGFPGEYPPANHGGYCDQRRAAATRDPDPYRQDRVDRQLGHYRGGGYMSMEGGSHWSY